MSDTLLILEIQPHPVKNLIYLAKCWSHILYLETP